MASWPSSPYQKGLAQALRPWLASKPANRPVFDGLSEKTGLMLKHDLERIGVPARGPDGRVVDMHSLRHGYVTSLAKSGIPVKTLQSLARHADPKTTLNIYAHLDKSDTAPSLDALPDFSMAVPADSTPPRRNPGG